MIPIRCETRPSEFYIRSCQFYRSQKRYICQIGKFAECAGDLSFVQIACAAVFVSLNNSSIVSFCCATKISRLEPRLKFKVRGREIGRARQTFQSGIFVISFGVEVKLLLDVNNTTPKCPYYLITTTYSFITD